MKRTISNIHQLNQVTHNLTAQNIINKRAYFTNGKTAGWNYFSLQDSAEQLEAIADLIGGHEKTKQAILNRISKPVSNSLLNRITFDSGIWQYTAIQDYKIELQILRNFLKR